MGGGIMSEKQEVKTKPKGGYIHLQNGVRSLEEALDNWEKIRGEKTVERHSKLEPQPPIK
jgi:hypothetical protein